jgi:thiosulfate/3-mercaptopyruvate sulfurtransferase
VTTDSNAQSHSSFINAAGLKTLLDAGANVVVLDARFDAAAIEAGSARAVDRIPGAVLVDVPTELAGATGAQTGRLPLPEVHDLQRDARRWGINQDSTVVVYDESKGTLAARAWWVLRWAGLADVRILDGGLAAWRAAGYAVTATSGVARLGSVTLSAGHLPAIDAAAALRLAQTGTLIDARARDAYEGQAGNAKTGHIPGAFSAPAGLFQEADGRLKPKEELRRVWAGVKSGSRPADQVGAYCGSGVAAAYAVAALHEIGLEASLYPGSWTEWVKQEQRPVAQGGSPQ